MLKFKLSWRMVNTVCTQHSFDDFSYKISSSLVVIPMYITLSSSDLSTNAISWIVSPTNCNINLMDVAFSHVSKAKYFSWQMQKLFYHSYTYKTDKHVFPYVMTGPEMERAVTLHPVKSPDMMYQVYVCKHIFSCSNDTCLASFLML